MFDGSLGNHVRGLAPFTNSNGTINFMIPANYGTQNGGNLFQSFSQFNLKSSQSATFCGPNTVHNILARVTSGSPSSIDGTINSDIQGANLFLLNPAGVMFGANAQVNVSGSFAVSTANYLKFADGKKFNTSLGGGDVLTSAPVSAFGFLSAAPAAVCIAGSNTSTLDPSTGKVKFVQPKPLNVATGKSFSVVAGDIAMNARTITGSGSRVNLVSVKSAGEAKLDATDLNSAIDVTQFTAMGTIDITSLARINSVGQRTDPTQPELGGPVFIRARTFLLDNSQIESLSFNGSVNKDGSVNSVNEVSKIDVQAQDVSILDNARISANTQGTADAGHVTVIADSLLIDGQGHMNTGLFALGSGVAQEGAAGLITVHAGNVTLMNSGQIGAYSQGPGNGGTVELTADSLLIDGNNLIGQGLSSGIFGDAKLGDGGNITITAGDVAMIRGGEISTGTFGSSKGGTITVTATHSLLINGTGSEEGLISGTNNPFSVFHGTGILALGYGSGDGGNITLKAPVLSIVGGGQIAAATFGTGNGGTVNATAGSLLIDGRGAVGNVLFGTGIFAGAESSSSGDGGSVFVQAADATITAGGQIAASTLGAGKGGLVNVAAKNSLVIHGSDSGLFAVAGFAGLANSGHGGDVVVSAGDLSLQNRGAISAASFTSGKAGSVHLTRVGTLSMDSGSSISSANTGTGDAGEVKINITDAVTLKHGSIISTASTSGNAGDITLNSGAEIKLKDQSSITGSAGGSGGNILITTPGLLYLLDSEISAVAVGGGGNFEIDSQTIVLNDSTIKTNAPPGQGGNQNLNSDFFFSSNSTIIATGTINITAPELDLGAQLITLPSSLLSAANQLQERCTTLLQGDFSSFISIGRGGTEPAPEELQEEF